MRAFIGPYPPGRPTDTRTFIWSTCRGCGMTIGPYVEDRDAMLHTIESSDHEKNCGRWDDVRSSVRSERCA